MVIHRQIERTSFKILSLSLDSPSLLVKRIMGNRLSATYVVGVTSEWEFLECVAKLKWTLFYKVIMNHIDNKLFFFFISRWFHLGFLTFIVKKLNTFISRKAFKLKLLFIDVTRLIKASPITFNYTNLWVFWPGWPQTNSPLGCWSPRIFKVFHDWLYILCAIRHILWLSFLKPSKLFLLFCLEALLVIIWIPSDWFIDSLVQLCNGSSARSRLFFPLTQCLHYFHITKVLYHFWTT